MKNDPTQVFKNFTNATEDLSRAFGDQLRPAVEGVTRLLTDFIVEITAFVNSPVGKTTMIFAALALAAKGVAIALPLVSAALIKVAAAGGVATLALNAIPFVAVATGIGAIVTQLIKQKKEQDEVTEAIKRGEIAQLRALEADIGIKMAKEISKINNSNDKRTIAAAERRLALLHDQMAPIKERLDIAIQDNAEAEKANKLEKERKEKIEASKKAAGELKEKMTAIGEEIESSIKNNLRDAITGAKTFGEPMTGVLNKIRDKIIDAQIDKIFGSFGENFGKSSTGGERKGLGGFLGGVIGGLFRANGGPVKANQPYIVGERQPELFVPRTSGNIVPSVPMGGESVVNNITVSVDATGSSVSGSSAEGNQLGEQIAAAIQSELIKQKRVGGLLA